MNHIIRQQTATRSPLVRHAGSTLPRQPIAPRPLSFMVDGTACTDDTLIHPRTMRQAFGHYAADMAPARITFLQQHRGGLRGIVVAVLVLAAIVGWGWK